MKQFKASRMKRGFIVCDARWLNYPEVWIRTIVHGNKQTIWLSENQAKRLHNWLGKWLAGEKKL